MIVKLTGGKVYDPASGVAGVVQDVYFKDGRIIDKPGDQPVDKEYD